MGSRKIHIMRAGHKVTLCGRWPSDKCQTVELHQVSDWAETHYCNSCTSASLRTTDLESINTARRQLRVSEQRCLAGTPRATPSWVSISGWPNSTLK